MSSPKNSGFLILHGWAGSGPEHWQSWLAQRLVAQGEFVRYPVLPDYDKPDLGAWLTALDQELAILHRFVHRVVVCHSLAVVLWLHHTQLMYHAHVQRLLFVAPPCPRGTLPEFASFFPVPLDAESLRRSAEEILLVCTGYDPYCPEQAAHYYGAALRIDTVILPPQAGHINVESGFGPWPFVMDWCLKSGGGQIG